MKSILYTLLLVCFISSSAEAQRKKSRDAKKRDASEAYVDMIFGKNDKDFDIMKAPEKWADEPAVILCQKSYFYYDNPNQIATTQLFVEIKGTTRKRILIQDKSALDDYSEYYYQDGGSIGLSVIKPDGTVNELDFNDAVEVKQDVPSYYRNKYRSTAYYKVAIPNLEVGDIIDFFAVYVDPAQSVISDVVTISEEYPVVKQEYIFDLPKKWTFDHMSFNGAPEIKLSKKGGANKSGKKKDSVRRFILEDSDREAASADRWDMPYLTEPTIKLLIHFKGFVAGYRVSQDLSNVHGVIDMYASFFKNDASLFANSSLMNWDTKELKKMPKAEKVYTLYNIVKFNFLKKSMEVWNQERTKSGDVFPYSQDFNEMSDAYFMFAFAKMLKRNKVKSDNVVIVPKHYGFTEDALTLEEYTCGIYVPSLDEYFFAPNNYSVPGERRAVSFGATGYKWDSSKKRKKGSKLEEIELLESKASDNGISSDMMVSLDQGQNITVEKNIDYTGVFKRSYAPFLLYNTTFVYDELYAISTKMNRKRMDAFNDKKSFKKNDWRAKRYQKRREKQEEKFQEFEEQKFEYVQEWVKEQYDVEEINDFEILNFGQKAGEPLSVKYSFDTEEYVKKAGPNLIFDIGKLITSQVELTEEEINERKKDVEIGYARTISNEISITIPEGKTVEGLDALNMNIDNESASFVSKAVLSGNTLQVTTNKVYKQEYLPLEKWKGLADMLEAAYKFSQQKVVIK